MQSYPILSMFHRNPKHLTLVNLITPSHSLGLQNSSFFRQREPLRGTPWIVYTMGSLRFPHHKGTTYRGKFYLHLSIHCITPEKNPFSSILFFFVFYAKSLSTSQPFTLKSLVVTHSNLKNDRLYKPFFLFDCCIQSKFFCYSRKRCLKQHFRFYFFAVHVFFFRKRTNTLKILD